MPDEQVFYDPLIVDSTHLNRMQADTAAALARLVGDHLGDGIAFGLALEQATPTPNLTLRVLAGAAYSSEGRRVEVPTATTVNLAADHLAASTAPSGSGQERVIAVYLRPARTQEEAYSDPSADPTTGYLRQRETYELLVVAGASAAATFAVPPTAPAGVACVLLGRVVRSHGQTQVFTPQILLADVVRAARAADVYADSVERRLEVSPTDPPSMALAVAGGAAQLNGVHLDVAAGTSPTFVAPSVNPCIALLGVLSNGALTVRYGAEALSPERPSARGLLPVAWVGLDPGQTAILDEHIEDARPWLSADTASVRVHRVVGTAAQTLVPLPFGYSQSRNELLVTVDGVTLDDTEFAETTQTSITLGAALGGGEVVVVRAFDVAPVGDDRSGLLVGGEVSAPSLGVVATTAIETLVIGGRSLSRAASPSDFPTSSAGTWYYLYGREGPPAGPGGPPLLIVEESLTQPDAARVWRSGARTHRYLAPVRTNGSGVAYPFRRVGGEHIWTRALIAGDTVALDAGAATSDATFSLAAWVPPHARTVRVFVSLEAPDAGGSAWIAAAGYHHQHLIRVGGGDGTQYAERELTLEVTAAQELTYKVTSGASLTVSVVSFGDR